MGNRRLLGHFDGFRAYGQGYGMEQKVMITAAWDSNLIKEWKRLEK